MCGIAGLALRRKAPDPELLSTMARTLDHRGPEDRGQFVWENVGLAHTRLSIIDLPGGHQPLMDADQRYALVCNGEIYNYIELLDELRALGAKPRSGSDSEAALHGWAHWGEASLQRLRGMYAFALLDRRRKALWLVRDRLGIKPLYYAPLADGLLFASELKAILPALPNKPSINVAALGQYFQNQHSSGRETIFQGIYRVLPGEAIRVDESLTLEHRRYWQSTAVEPRQCNEAEAIEQWEPLFEQVMREHMRSDVPVGAFLSGGVDSAVLLAQLHRFQSRPVRTYSIGWSDAKQKDELEGAQRIADLFGADHQPIRLSSQQVFRRLPRSVWAADDLMRDYACLPTMALAEVAAQDLKVVFSGEGGDEAFAGYGRYRPGWVERQFKSLRYPGSGGFRARGELRGRLIKGLFKPELQAALQTHRTPYTEAWSETPPSWSDLQRRQHVDLNTNLPDDLLVKADRMLMAFSLEGRVPFLDHRVVEFGLSLPDALKVNSNAGKLLIKRWAESFLPADHLWRKKSGFHVPVGEWLGGAFLASLATALPRNDAIRQWCVPEVVKNLIARQQQKADCSREVWNLMQFAIWHRLFVEGDSSVPGVQDNPLDYL